MTVEGSQIAQKAQIFLLGPAALGIPKGDACYRRDARNEGNKGNGHADDTDSALMGVDEKKVVVKPNYYF